MTTQLFEHFCNYYFNPVKKKNIASKNNCWQIEKIAQSWLMTLGGGAVLPHRGRGPVPVHYDPQECYHTEVEGLYLFTTLGGVTTQRWRACTCSLWPSGVLPHRGGGPVPVHYDPRECYHTEVEGLYLFTMTLGQWGVLPHRGGGPVPVHYDPRGVLPHRGVGPVPVHYDPWECYHTEVEGLYLFTTTLGGVTTQRWRACTCSLWPSGVLPHRGGGPVPVHYDPRGCYHTEVEGLYLFTMTLRGVTTQRWRGCTCSLWPSGVLLLPHRGGGPVPVHYDPWWVLPHRGGGAVPVHYDPQGCYHTEVEGLYMFTMTLGGVTTQRWRACTCSLWPSGVLPHRGGGAVHVHYDPRGCCHTEVEGLYLFTMTLWGVTTQRWRACTCSLWPSGVLPHRGGGPVPVHYDPRGCYHTEVEGLYLFTMTLRGVTTQRWRGCTCSLWPSGVLLLPHRGGGPVPVHHDPRECYHTEVEGLYLFTMTLGGVTTQRWRGCTCSLWPSGVLPHRGGGAVHVHYDPRGCYHTEVEGLYLFTMTLGGVTTQRWRGCTCSLWPSGVLPHRGGGAVPVHYDPLGCYHTEVEGLYLFTMTLGGVTTQRWRGCTCSLWPSGVLPHRGGGAVPVHYDPLGCYHTEVEGLYLFTMTLGGVATQRWRACTCSLWPSGVLPHRGGGAVHVHYDPRGCYHTEVEGLYLFTMTLRGVTTQRWRACTCSLWPSGVLPHRGGGPVPVHYDPRGCYHTEVEGLYLFTMTLRGVTTQRWRACTCSLWPSGVLPHRGGGPVPVHYDPRGCYHTEVEGLYLFTMTLRGVTTQRWRACTCSLWPSGVLPHRGGGPVPVHYDPRECYHTEVEGLYLFTMTLGSVTTQRWRGCTCSLWPSGVLPHRGGGPVPVHYDPRGCYHTEVEGLYLFTMTLGGVTTQRWRACTCSRVASLTSRSTSASRTWRRRVLATPSACPSSCSTSTTTTRAAPSRATTLTSRRRRSACARWRTAAAAASTGSERQVSERGQWRAAVEQLREV